MKRVSFVSFAASALVFAGGIAFSPASAAPMHPAAAAAPPHAIVQVECRYGSRHCVNPNPGPKPPKIGGKKLPDSGWEDPDCKYYGSCGTGTPGNWGDPAALRSGTSMPYQPGRFYR